MCSSLHGRRIGVPREMPMRRDRLDEVVDGFPGFVVLVDEHARVFFAGGSPAGALAGEPPTVDRAAPRNILPGAREPLREADRRVAINANTAAEAAARMRDTPLPARADRSRTALPCASRRRRLRREPVSLRPSFSRGRWHARWQHLSAKAWLYGPCPSWLDGPVVSRHLCDATKIAKLRCDCAASA